MSMVGEKGQANKTGSSKNHGILCLEYETKSSILCYLIFVKKSQKGSSVLQWETKEDLELAKFLQEFQDIFTYDICGDVPPTRGIDNHSIGIIPGSSLPNKPPYTVSQAQQEEVMRQVSELVDKGMARPLIECA